jgi:HAD superfamily hydrolase (TIGR01509 family)
VRPFRAVLFDAGDTLIRLSGSGERLLHRAAAVLGGDRLDAEDAARVWQRILSRASTPEELAKGRDLSPDRHREVWTALYAEAGCDRLVPGLSAALYVLTVDAGSWEVFPDTLPTLQALHTRGVRVGIVSDTGFDLRPVFDALGLLRWLDAVILSFEHGACKPDPRLFVTACERLGMDPAETLMVGDNPLTDAGAVTAGLCVLLLPRPTPAGPRGLRHVLSLVPAPESPLPLA